MAHDIESRLKTLGITLPTPGAPAANLCSDGHHRKPPVRVGPSADDASGNSVRRQGRPRVLHRRGPRGGKDLRHQHSRQYQGGDRRSRPHQALRQGRRIRQRGARLHRSPQGDQRRVRLHRGGAREQGRHARSAIGVGTLPLGTAVEVEAIVEIV